jgi:hypothetical protein
MCAWFGKCCVIVALVVSTGAHWAALQTVAWTAMFVDNLRTDSLVEAVTHTFDGKHPCALCKAITAGKKSEQKGEFTLQTQKLEFPPSPENFTLVAPSHFQLLPLANAFAESLPLRPPTPPPRNLFA